MALYDRSYPELRPELRSGRTGLTLPRATTTNLALTKLRLDGAKGSGSQAGSPLH